MASVQRPLCLRPRHMLSRVAAERADLLAVYSQQGGRGASAQCHVCACAAEGALEGNGGNYLGRDLLQGLPDGCA